MVGHAEELTKVKEMLLQHTSSEERQVISIVGMGGIGKTTLAKTIYCDPLVTSHFDLLGWATMSQDYNLGKILDDLCSSLHIETNQTEIDQQAHKLRQCLMGQRYLIVVDDIWDTRAWDNIQRCFPDDVNGSRVLLTTRLKEVADYTTGSCSCICELPFLSPDESWELFCQTFNNNKHSLSPELEQIGKCIVHKCKGLPLAIAVVAGLLLKTDESLENWQSIEAEMSVLISNLDEQFSNVLSLSYNHLPYHLRACFLYFGVFPEDSEVQVKNLIPLWIAEGFIMLNEQKSLEDVAKDNLQDLIDRNLVLVSRKSFHGDIKACRIHDLLHDLCLREAKDEKLVSISPQRKCYENASRWLRFEARSSWPKFTENYTFCRSRSLFFPFCKSKYPGSPIKWSLNYSFKLIRVLEMRSFSFMVASNFDIVDLVLRRYLALPSIMSVGKMKHHQNLQTLIVGRESAGFGGNSSHEWWCGIWKSQNLRYIYYPDPIKINNTDDSVHEKLHTVYWLPYLQCTKQFVSSCPNVKVLGVSCDGFFTQSEIEIFWDSLRCLTKLEKLTVQGGSNFWEGQLPSIDSLPLTLKKLKLVDTYFKWEDITAISMLPNLETLKLSEQYMGEEWETVEGGFRRLRFLSISGAISGENLKRWKTAGDHFPVLERLSLCHCYYLEEIPDGFADIITLKLIELTHCGSSLVNSVWRLQEEQQSL